MILIAHILIALASVAYSSFLIIRPSRSGIGYGYDLIGLTLISGTWLVIASHSNILQSCLTGLLYSGFVTTQLAVARYRLSKQLERE